MIRKYLLSAMILLVMAGSVSAARQMVNRRHPCTGDTVWVTDTLIFNYNSNAVTETYQASLLGVTKEWRRYATAQEWEDFIQGTLDLVAMNCGGSPGGATSLPATAAAATFQHTVFTALAKPRMSVPLGPPAVRAVPSTTAPAPEQSSSSLTGGEAAVSSGASEQAVAPPVETSTESGKAVELDVVKKEAGTRPMLPPNNVTTDLEWNVFSMRKNNGNNFSLRAGYNRTLSNDKITVGGTFVINTMVMLDKVFFNNALNLSGTYLLTESSTLERKVGASVNTFIVDKEFYGTPFGMSIVGSFGDNWFINDDNIVTYGGMVQESFVGDVKTTLLTAGVLVGLPLFERYAINPSCVVAYNALTIGKNGVISVTSPFMFQPAFNGSVYFTRAFTLDIGAKTTLFIKDYADFILTVGATILF